MIENKTIDQTESWDLIITGKKSLFSLQLNDIWRMGLGYGYKYGYAYDYGYGYRYGQNRYGYGKKYGEGYGDDVNYE